MHVVLEATGGYEVKLRTALHAGGYPLSVIQPARARHFARARANHAKTDPIDAEVLAAFGTALQPAPTPAPSPAQVRLAALVGRRSQLVEMRTAEILRTEHALEPFVVRQLRAHLAWLNKEIAQCDKQIAAQIAADADLQARTSRLREMTGIGPVIAALLQAEMPELGRLAHGQAAALAGVAPYNRDSGTQQGVRFIRGGRATVRCALYLAAMSAIRHDAICRAFYKRLRAAGKLKMVALTAVMRKLVELLNRMLKNPSFTLTCPRRHSPPERSPKTPGSGAGEAPVQKHTPSL